MSFRSKLFLVVLSFSPLAACEGKPKTNSVPAETSAVDAGALRIDRVEFNRIAEVENAPIYWAHDQNANGMPDDDELVSVLFYGPTSPPSAKDARSLFLAGKEKARLRASSPEKMDERSRLVFQEVEQGRPVLVRSDFRKAPAYERAFVERMLIVAEKVDALYAKQRGLESLIAKPTTNEEKRLFLRNWGPACESTKFSKVEKCSALANVGRPPVDVYPASIQTAPSFCQTLEKRAEAKTLLSPFTVVREEGTKLIAVPYSVAYASEMKAVSEAILEAEKALASYPSDRESGLRGYLTAVAQSFLDNKWDPADEAWAKLDGERSAYYVRVGPDEVYWEPCAHKAGFHLSFALINKDSLEWRTKLLPVRQAMEQSLAKDIGAPYSERKVSFHLPDFIDIIVNAGDARQPFGALTGQSLPNWGPVTASGRGRTVVMTNLGNDPDSRVISRERAESIFDRDTLATFPSSARAELLSTVLHEATHNLGPSHEYKVGGRTDTQVFGGGYASMMEELKAQSGSFYYVPWLLERKLIDDKLAAEVYTDNLLWSMGQISHGMVASDGSVDAYAQLSAVQVGFLMEQGVLTWKPDQMAANGKDKGAFSLSLPKMAAASFALMQLVGKIKATGDRGGAELLAQKFVVGPMIPQAIIRERYGRFPQTTYVYAVDR